MTLSQYYQSIGQSLPSLQQRAQLYQQLGLGTNYTGTADQNTTLLSSLQSGGSGAFSVSAMGTQGATPPTMLTANPTSPTSQTSYAPTSSPTASPLSTTQQNTSLQNLINSGSAYDVNGNPVSKPATISTSYPTPSPTTNITSTSTYGNTAIGAPLVVPAGVDPNLWAQLDPGSQAFVESLSGLAKSTYDTGASNFSINAQTLQQALQAAQNDPAIKAKYGDAAIIAQKDLQNNLGFLNSEYAQNMGLLTQQQTQQRKDFEGQQAAAGRAYSGFRQQAEDLLKQEQSGVIQSSQRQLQQQLQNLGSSYEQQYGTSALSKVGPISAGGFNYQQYGGIQGSVPFQQQADIQAKQQQIYSQEANPLVQ